MESDKISILYVDDEISNLNAFKANFRFEYDIIIVNSVEEAYEVLKSKPELHIIIADQRMPGMTGVQFFESILDVYKDPIRILLTAYTDVEAAIDSINKGKVFRFIRKPWDEQEIRMSIQNAYEVYCAKRELCLKNQELQKINEELNRFVYSASHDLKAPLMSIKGLLYVAQLEGNTRNPEEYFSMITDSVNQLEVFIGNIINYYKNQRVENQYTYIDFTKVVCETIENHECYHHSSRISYNLDIEADEKFLSDEFRIRVIVNNILSNAIKYQRPDEAKKTIIIKVKVQDGIATIVIEDNGIGIEEQYIGNIYKMFYRATRENSGSGIGLYIVHEAVSKVDGEISVFSKPGLGTRFTITIPSKELVD